MHTLYMHMYTSVFWVHVNTVLAIYTVIKTFSACFLNKSMATTVSQC